VKLVVLSPLKMAGFYSPPFRMRTEAPVQIALEDEGKSYEDELTCWCFKIASGYWWWNRKKPDFPSRKQFLRHI